MVNCLHRVCLLVCLLFTGGFSYAALASTDSPSAEASVTEIIQMSRVNRDRSDSVYNRAILEHGNLDRVIEVLSQHASDSRLPPGQRVNALLLSSDLYWRNGQQGKALAAAKRALGIEKNADTILQHARLLDASGEIDAAQALYENALGLLEEAGEKMPVRLRLAIIKVVDGDPQALVTLALSQDQEFRNRAATALAILGHHEEAIDLFQVTSTDDHQRFREHIRLADWALRAGKPELAQEQAWQSVEISGSVKDRLYGLSILVEAYRTGDNLEQLIARLANQESTTFEARRVLTDLLRESGKYEEALAVFASYDPAEMTPALRRELINIYAEAGREGAIVTEYQKLIGESPGAISGYEGLGEYLMSVGKPAAARKVWENFVQANENDVAVLLAGARVMARTGFETIAIESLRKHVGDSRNTASILFFEFDIHLESGRVAAAESALARLDEALPPLAKQRTELADSYDRLGQPQRALVVWEALAGNAGTLGYDEEIRLASLYSKLGNKQKALEMWQSLWGRVTMPARRNFVEDRMMSMADDLGRLDDIAVELSNKLANKAASRNDSSLLVRIYIKMADTASAIKVVQEYFGDDEQVEALNEQADVYLLLTDFKNYNRVLRRLAEVDPANKPDYLRKLILSAIAQIEQSGITEQRVGGIRELLSQLREIDQEAVGGEFEAGVLVLVELDEEAIESYRRATAENPDESGSYLLMGDLLRKKGRVSEAIAMYQYLTEAYGQDRRFVTGVDGVINMMAAHGAEDPGDRPLEWTRRHILERLISHGDESYLYQALSDVAEEMNDDAAYIAVVENMLALRGISRSGTLRQLIRFTAPEGAGPGLADTAKHSFALETHLAYGRRLVALDEEFPPSVYLDLGKVFLDLKDPINAAKAFNMAQDITGRRNIREQAGERFEQAGYDRQAVEQYVRALIGDSSNIPTMLKLAGLREKLGQGDEANGLYVQALHTLLLRQPATIQVAQDAAREVTASPSSPFTFTGFDAARRDESVTYEFGDYYESLLNGALLTWPDERTLDESNWTIFEDMLTRELTRIVASQDNGTLDRFRAYSRLDRMSRLVRRLAFSLGRTDLVDRLDVQLLKHFGSDSDFYKHLVDVRMDWGLHKSARFVADQASVVSADAYNEVQLQLEKMSGDRMSLTDEVLETAKKSESFDFALNLSILSGEGRKMLAVASAWAESGAYRNAVRWGKARLNGEQYRDLCRYVARLVRDEEDIFEVLSYDFSVLADIEEATGEAVFTPAELMEMLKESVGAGLGVEDPRFFIRPQTSDDILSLLETVVADSSWAESLDLVGGLWSELLTRSLTPEVSAQLADLITRQLQKVRIKPGGESPLSSVPGGIVIGGTGGGVLGQVANGFFPQDIDKDNVDLAAKVASFWYDKAAEDIEFYTPVLLLRRGKTSAAVDAFIRASLAVEKGGEDVQYLSALLATYRPAFLPAHSSEMKAQLEAMEVSAGASPEMTELRFKLFFSGESTAPDERLSFLEEARVLHPTKPGFLVRLYHIYKKQGLVLEQLDILERLLAIDSANMVYRIALFELLRELDKPVRALRLNDNSTEDMRPVGTLEEVYRREEQRGFSFSAVLPGGFASSSFGSISAGSALSLLQERQIEGASRVFGGLFRPTAFVTELAAATKTQDADMVRSRLRALWQNEFASPGSRNDFGGAPSVLATYWPGSPEDTDRASPDFNIIEASGRPVERRKLLDVMTQYEFSVEEFEVYLRAMDTSRMAQLVPHLAKAYRLHGLSDQRTASLTALLREGDADLRDFTLWLYLLNNGVEVPSSDIVSILDEWYKHYTTLSQQQLMLMARVYARSDQVSHAVKIYRYLAAKILKSSSLGSSNPISLGLPPELSGETSLSAIAFVDEVSQYLVGQDLLDVLDDVVQLAEPEGRQLTNDYARFVMLTLQRALGATDALSMSLSQLGAVDDNWSIGSLVELSNLYARAGELAPALDVLELVVRRNQSSTVAVFPFNFTDASASGSFGLRNDYLRSSDALTLSEKLFPAPENHWAGSDEWLLRAGARLSELVMETDIDTNRTARLMLVIAYRLYQAGQQDAADSLLKDVSQTLIEKGSVHNETTSLAIAVAEKIDRPLDLDVMTGLLKDGRLTTDETVNLIKRTAEVRGTRAASALGESALKLTASDALLNQLILAADDSGDAAGAERWRKLRKDAAAARKQLRPADF